MKTKMLTVLLACCMVAVLENVILSLQDDLQAADPQGELDPLTVNTMILLDQLQAAVSTGDAAGLTGIVEDYAAAIAPMQDNQTQTNCFLPLLFSVFGSTTTMLNTIADGGDPNCVSIKLTNSVADIISAVQTYRICNIDNSATPDEEQRAQIVQRQTLVKTYNFITNLLYTSFCKEAPSFFDWLSVFFDFLGIFPKAEPEATAL